MGPDITNSPSPVSLTNKLSQIHLPNGHLSLSLSLTHTHTLQFNFISTKLIFYITNDVTLNQPQISAYMYAHAQLLKFQAPEPSSVIDFPSPTIASPGKVEPEKLLLFSFFIYVSINLLPFFYFNGKITL